MVHEPVDLLSQLLLAVSIACLIRSWAPWGPWGPWRTWGPSHVPPHLILLQQADDVVDRDGARWTWRSSGPRANALHVGYHPAGDVIHRLATRRPRWSRRASREMTHDVAGLQVL